MLTARPSRAAGTMRSGCTPGSRGCVSKWKPSFPTVRPTCRTDQGAVRSRPLVGAPDYARSGRHNAARSYPRSLQADREDAGRTGVSETSLDEEIPIPEDGLYLWFYFQELSGGRINSGFGPRHFRGPTWKHGPGSPPRYSLLTKSSLCAAWTRPFCPPMPLKQKSATRTPRASHERHDDGRN